jgi:hypothetical protein
VLLPSLAVATVGGEAMLSSLVLEGIAGFLSDIPGPGKPWQAPPDVQDNRVIPLHSCYALTENKAKQLRR